MIIVYILIGAVLGSLGTVVYLNHQREARLSRDMETAPQAYADFYRQILEKFSNPSIPRLRQTSTLSHDQKDLLQVLNESSGIVADVRSMVRVPKHLLPNFLIDTENTEFDRNGCVELWVHISDDVSEVYYLSSTNLSILTDVLNRANMTFERQLMIIAKGSEQ
ncbi:hypothetical protein pEaSNUABM37_00069 [Erwinia phage pEa_SNUABM_37]|nr:hypothetical protein pEaSNUABM37_00069 [Erwinia phage pEa_SNUABM_37]QXO10539.1 hypothetical protein pEaSNUABM48_00069 [Erwinia phage pEa_SNUABM_48]